MTTTNKPTETSVGLAVQSLCAAPCSAIRGVPEGCMEIPGYILDVFDGSAWITQDGRVTDKWAERGVWPTPEAAAEMMERCLSPNAGTQRPGTPDGSLATETRKPGSLK